MHLPLALRLQSFLHFSFYNFIGMPKWNFLNIVGLEGSGKTTQANLLAENLDLIKLDFRKINKKYISPKKIAVYKKLDKDISSSFKFLKKEIWPVSSTTRMAYFFTRFAQLNEFEIKPLINLDKQLVDDGYFYKVLAREYALGRKTDLFLDLFEESLVLPDKTIYLNVPVNQAFLRRFHQENKSFSFFEKKSKKKITRKRILDLYKKMDFWFKKIARKRNWIFVDNTKSVAEVQKEILQVLK